MLLDNKQLSHELDLKKMYNESLIISTISKTPINLLLFQLYASLLVCVKIDYHCSFILGQRHLFMNLNIVGRMEWGIVKWLRCTQSRRRKLKMASNVEMLRNHLTARAMLWDKKAQRGGYTFCVPGCYNNTKKNRIYFHWTLAKLKIFLFSFFMLIYLLWWSNQGKYCRKIPVAIFPILKTWNFLLHFSLGN